MLSLSSSAGCAPEWRNSLLQKKTSPLACAARGSEVRRRIALRVSPELPVLMPGQARGLADAGAERGVAAHPEGRLEHLARVDGDPLARTPVTVAFLLDLELAPQRRLPPGADLPLRLPMGHEREPPRPQRRLGPAVVEVDTRGPLPGGRAARVVVGVPDPEVYNHARPLLPQ